MYSTNIFTYLDLMCWQTFCWLVRSILIFSWVNCFNKNCKHFVDCPSYPNFPKPCQEGKDILFRLTQISHTKLNMANIGTFLVLSLPICAKSVIQIIQAICVIASAILTCIGYFTYNSLLVLHFSNCSLFLTCLCKIFVYLTRSGYYQWIEQLSGPLFCISLAYLDAKSMGPQRVGHVIEDAAHPANVLGLCARAALQGRKMSGENRRILEDENNFTVKIV